MASNDKVRLRRASALALALALFGCSADPAPDDTIRIHMAAVFSKTGVSAVTTWNDAFDLAADDVSRGLREAGFPTGKRLSFDTMVADTRNDQSITVARALEMVQGGGAKLVINGTSSDSVALGRLAYDDDPSNDLDVPIVCVACSSPLLHEPNATHADPALQSTYRNPDKWMFGLAMSSAPQSRVLWNILKDETPPGNAPGDLNGDGRVKISTIALDDAFGTGFQDAMANVVKAASPGAVFERTKHSKDADVNQYRWGNALDLLTDNLTDDETDYEPDVLMEFTFPQFSLSLVKAYTGSIPFMHTHSMRERTVVLSAMSKLEGHEGTSYLPSDGLSGAMFDQRFLAVRQIARQSQWDSDVYDGAFLFALGTVKASMNLEDPGSVTGAQIRDAMLDLNDPDGVIIRIGPDEFAKAAKLISQGLPINYEGASGPCDFDAHGRARNRISHWRVVDGDVREINTYNCLDDETCPRQ